ncbi:MAG: hypothetical protein A3F82_11115 [Deltaproteobacteria bacterium RIFCSPLOWO2_12_FULL_44_12]|nr:MAG: hypothetical protein A2712_09115 [Deltaproteobacteria bacterium RIFCSPHIGHO2_01_FULL_43_49]OGQ14509.1 MAG: hypothetical protein A3D22_07885 [Deltaproteobacteria bacterium RIFCSPHIGHO2_02_FULL_44_53]OGQ27895.1 MAG: hypothetical protein A3D98_06595 [Deltaproteobacteria bacterium RIFCSPHIGHO2_12_FULL_44_21]OGQ31107.1 MAG: hypothetical protein A2979_06645 [Deltaproteobacteria bacterium RIFCSPLOWO2_01_FULL_45_74]OGQ43098.1 MAG: hypothetical protein A3I70_00300 [Deltaproteobacteria bacterium 
MHAKKQYTIRGISTTVDRALKQKAKTEGKSLNTVLVDSLTKAVGVSPETIIFHDLDDLIGKWQEDPEFDRSLEEQNKIDPQLWK